MSTWLDSTLTPRAASNLEARLDTRVINARSPAVGAVGDGSADDRANLQSGLTAAAGKTFLIPDGTYKIGAELVPPSNTRILGSSARGTKLILANGANSKMIATADDGVQRYGMHISNLGFDGNAANQTGALPIIDVRGMNEAIFDDLYIVNPRGSGIRIGQATGGMFCTVPIFTRIIARGDATNSQASAIELNSGSSDAQIANCDIGFFSLAGGVVLSGHSGAQIANTNVWQCYYGYFPYQSDRLRISNCLADLSKRHGFVTQECSDVQISNCQARESSQATANTYDGFAFLGATGATRPNNTLLSNCRAMGAQQRVGVALNQHMSYVRVIAGSMVGNAIASTVVDTDVLDYQFLAVAGVTDIAGST